jgi:signal transduction histidine kinase
MAVNVDRVSPSRPTGGTYVDCKHLRLSRAYSEIERLSTERTAELGKLSQRLLKVQDEERRKLARDLHDSTGQTLAALKISVSKPPHVLRCLLFFNRANRTRNGVDRARRA